MENDGEEGLKIHPIAEVFPRMSNAEFEALVEDIDTYGVREPVWTWNKQVIDGRHRVLACEQLGIECPTREYEGPDSGVIAFRIQKNMVRRHLNESQRAMVAAKLVLLAEIEQEAKEERCAQWVKDARAEFRPKRKLPEPCFVCGRYERLTHAHHIYPLYMQAMAGAKVPNQEYKWLCPTHHVAAHRKIDSLMSNKNCDLLVPLAEAGRLEEVVLRFVYLHFGRPH